MSIKIKINPKFTLKSNNNLYWLFNTEDGDIYKLNETGYFILNNINYQTLSDCKKEFDYTYRGTKSLDDDFFAFIALLFEYGILEMTAKAPTRWTLFQEIVADCPDCKTQDNTRIYCSKHLEQKEAIKLEAALYQFGKCGGCSNNVLEKNIKELV